MEERFGLGAIRGPRRPGRRRFSAVAGLLDPIPRHARHGLHLRLTEPEDADLVINVLLALGSSPVGVVESRRIEPGRAVPVEPGWAASLSMASGK